jgi:ATP-binding cassette subfamily B protein
MIIGDVLALATQSITPFVFARMIDGPISHRDHSGLWNYAVLLLVLAGVQTACYALRRWPTADSVSVEASLRRAMYRQLLRLPALYHERRQSGHSVSRVMGDVKQIGLFHHHILVFLISNSVTLMVTSAMLIVVHPVLGVLVLVALVPLGMASTVFQNRFTAVARAARGRVDNLATVVDESVMAAKVLKSLGGGGFAAVRFNRVARAAGEAELSKVRLNSVFTAALAAYPLVVLAFVVCGAGFAVATGSISIGSFVAFTTFYLRMLSPVTSMGNLLSGMQDTVNAVSRVAEVFDAEVTIADPPRPVPLPRHGLLAVRLEDVWVDYPGGVRPVLAGVDLEIAAGETMALVGVTGSGKTTVTNLVGRLAEPTAGRVLVGGVDIRDLTLDDLRGSIGMAFEDATLFSTTVLENLTAGRDGITDREITAALDISMADFVHDLPDGLRTVVGELGRRLSGGQCQRLALARALLAHPRLLVLDDPMSALDVRTENAVEQRLRQAFASTTVLLVARRPSTAALADRVAVLDAGRVVDVGTHAELMARSEMYRHVLVSADGTVDG